MRHLILAMLSACSSSGVPSTPPIPEQPEHNGTVSVSKTIVITKPGVYDYGSKLHVWKGANWNCTGDKENGPQILRIEADNVTVKNFYFIGDGTNGSNGLGDPIHITSCKDGQGNLCHKRGPRNVVLDGIVGHACEDLITVGTPGGRDITVKNSYLKANPSKANWDKTVQINFGENINFINNDFIGGKFCIRYKPQTSGEVIGNRFYGCKNGVRATSNDADIRPMRNGKVKVTFTGNKCYGCEKDINTTGDVEVIR